MRAMQQEGNGRLLEPIHGLISPDLPTKVSLLDFFYSLLSSNMFSSTEDKERQPVVDMHTVLRSGIQGLKCWQVRTVAAQTRTMAQIQELMVKRAEQIDNSGCGGALLLVSGGHPLREHWLTGKLTPADSFSMFHAAKLLQDSGLLPPVACALWKEYNSGLWRIPSPTPLTVLRKRFILNKFGFLSSVIAAVLKRSSFPSGFALK
jgi:hypothetical protein